MKDDVLPPQPSSKPLLSDKKLSDVPFVVYINGKPMEMSKKEALTVMAQVVNILMYLDEDKERK